jgi:hypothetical protein
MTVICNTVSLSTHTFMRGTETDPKALCAFFLTTKRHKTGGGGSVLEYKPLRL